MDFFNAARRRNPKLLETAAELHRSGQIPPETYVIDADMVSRNARLVAAECACWGLRTYFEAKQFARIPLLCRRLLDAGFTHALAIDIEEAKTLHAHGIPVAHVGHLGQIPVSEIDYVLGQIRPEVITVYSVDKAEQIAGVARRLGMVQPLLLRVNGPGDIVSSSVAGGFREEDILPVADAIGGMSGVELAGVTTYPSIRYDLRAQEWVFTPNFETLIRTRDVLRHQLGIPVTQVNAAGNTCVSTIQMLVEGGATHGEPGHAFVGSNPGHAFHDFEEIPAQVFVTEVSHRWAGSAFAYATGLIANPTVGVWNPSLYDDLQGAVGHDSAMFTDGLVWIEPPFYAGSDPSSYMYARIKPARNLRIAVGDTVVLAMRTQLYKMTSARAAVVAGIQTGDPTVLGLFDRNGNLLDDETWLPVGRENQRLTERAIMVTA